jgi:hypothetical protein
MPEEVSSVSPENPLGHPEEIAQEVVLHLTELTLDADPAFLMRVYAILGKLADVGLVETVQLARKEGMQWTEIAENVGISPSFAFRRFDAAGRSQYLARRRRRAT